ncbi:MAG: hypothetical protein AAF611_16930 [Bacteroidota bacterium]
MKKRNLKSLNLNKKSISRLQSDEITGGTGVSWALIKASIGFCITDTCISTVYEGPVKETCANC